MHAQADVSVRAGGGKLSARAARSAAMLPVALSDSEEEQQGEVDAQRQREQVALEENEEEMATQMMRDQMEEPVPLSQHRAPAAAPAGYTRVSLHPRRP